LDVGGGEERKITENLDEEEAEGRRLSERRLRGKGEGRP